MISSQSEPLVIIGASHAGTHLAMAAREQGFDGPIVLIGDEPHAPYHRPPLSKGMLTGKTGIDQLALYGPDFYVAQRIELRIGQRATALDPATRHVRLADGSSLKYGWLALATGARCRPLRVPGADLQGVYQLRTLDDALAVRQRLAYCSSVCIIGGGFIGLEVAAALNSVGTRVTVVESQTRLLARAFPEFMSDYVATAHRRRGVSLELGCSVRELLGCESTVEAVRLDDGRTLDCDLVLVGIGVLPNTELAEAAGIRCGDGILVDALGRTSAPRVLAVGDVANMAQPASVGKSIRMRFESIQAASDGARAAASVLVDRPQPLSAVPWFWSEQHDLKFQMAGMAAHGDQLVLRGEPASDRFTAFYLRDGAVAAAHSINRPADHMLARKLISQRARIPVETLSDLKADLKPFVDTSRAA
ncbi:NAD(P)/FAD-dependent oxidoreductase [Burkholderia multivorans]|uniref:NAD(P)/FAD-dependent oxidoreductase n=1 Tax=Burkholderia multivorans TaxID=87883 RepID=UPI00207C5719|nr:FAD-dependent oxidoreductase [Burkholderia multivorans]MCA8143551.1 FAD-dependent oxidoreductase [Burkholderia multivorans]MCO1368561.1 FAD-dependent oxidoreductase [Burkholderia multivorans]MCO1380452.1 FAD-dependent oxidoreductase [Burkholderia multivorans]MDN8032152.1 FAD-dependent oxidoreductase [Burkholderia multivorans]UQP92115.1 FAD-dependent oxidoreductase [Burkholderia multivorans]